MNRPILFQICVEGNRGSTGTIAESIGVMAMKGGWDSYIAYGRFPRPSQSKLIRIESKWGVFLHGLQTRLFDRHCLGSKCATQRLVKEIKEINPDIIHLHHIHGYYINMKILFDFLRNANIPVVWTFHDCWSFTGHCGYFDYAKCEKWKTECYSCPQKKGYPKSIFIDRSKKNFYLKKYLFTSVQNMTIVPVSNWLANVVRQSFFKQIPIRTIHNGVDINTFSPQEGANFIRQKYNIDNKLMLLGVATTWDSRKGLKDYIKLSSYIDEQTMIVLVGLTKAQIKKLPKGIMGIERTENIQELVNLYSTADILVNLSYEETFGLTIVEAMACGTPAIVYNATACPEIISLGTGFAVETGNINAVVEAILSCQANGKAYYSEACRERAIKLYDKNVNFFKYIELYNSLGGNN